MPVPMTVPWAGSARAETSTAQFLAGFLVIG